MDRELPACRCKARQPRARPRGCGGWALPDLPTDRQARTSDFFLVRENAPRRNEQSQTEDSEGAHAAYTDACTESSRNGRNQAKKAPDRVTEVAAMLADLSVDERRKLAGVLMQGEMANKGVKPGDDKPDS